MTPPPQANADKITNDTKSYLYDRAFEDRFKDDLESIPSTHRKEYRYCESTKQVYHQDFYTYEESKNALIPVDIPKTIRAKCKIDLEQIKRERTPSYEMYEIVCNEFLGKYTIETSKKDFDTKAVKLCTNSIKSITRFTAETARNNPNKNKAMSKKGKISEENNGYFELVLSAVKQYVRTRKTLAWEKDTLEEDSKGNTQAEVVKLRIYTGIFMDIKYYLAAWNLKILKETIIKMYPEMGHTINDDLSMINNSMKIVLEKRSSIIQRSSISISPLPLMDKDYSNEQSNVKSVKVLGFRTIKNDSNSDTKVTTINDDKSTSNPNHEILTKTMEKVCHKADKSKKPLFLYKRMWEAYKEEEVFPKDLQARVKLLIEQQKLIPPKKPKTPLPEKEKEKKENNENVPIIHVSSFRVSREPDILIERNFLDQQQEGGRINFMDVPGGLVRLHKRGNLMNMNYGKIKKSMVTPQSLGLVLIGSGSTIINITGSLLWVKNPRIILPHSITGIDYTVFSDFGGLMNLPDYFPIKFVTIYAKEIRNTIISVSSIMDAISQDKNDNARFKCLMCSRALGRLGGLPILEIKVNGVWKMLKAYIIDGLMYIDPYAFEDKYSSGDLPKRGLVENELVFDTIYDFFQCHYQSLKLI